MLKQYLGYIDTTKKIRSETPAGTREQPAKSRKISLIFWAKAMNEALLRYCTGDAERLVTKQVGKEAMLCGGFVSPAVTGIISY